MKSYIQILTVPTADTSGACLLLHFDNRRYLLGHMAEGTMRALNELNISLRKVQKILVSGRTSRETTGGLLGLLLTMADANASAAAELKSQGKTPKSESGLVSDEIEVFGPPNLVHSVAAARKFIFRKSTPTRIRDVKDEAPVKNESGERLPSIVDPNMDVFALVVKPNGSERDTNEEVQEPSEGVGDDESAEDLVRQRIIDDMFNSKWRLDSLVETYLKDVVMPAKIWVRNHQTKDLELYQGPLPGGDGPLPNPFLKVFVRNPWPASQVAKLPPTSATREAVSYIVRGRLLRGKFDRAKAVELGVPPGPLFAQLTKGNSIKLDNGSVVEPHQVLGPDIQAGGFALLDLPSEEYIEGLLAKEELNSAQVTAGVGTYFWLLGPGVSDNPALQQFILDRPDIEHIICSPDHSKNHLVALGAAQSAIKLAQVDQSCFPVPYFDNSSSPAPNFRREAGLWARDVDPQLDLFALPNVTLAQRGITVQLDPKLEVQESSAVPPLDTMKLISTAQSQEVIEIANEVHKASVQGSLAQELEEWRKSVPYSNVEVVTLGTGSAMPSRYRNVSSTLVRVPGWGSYLLDAGENTMGQLQRVYTPSELVDVLKDLRLIWISHGHADHHLGTASVIKAWFDVVHGKATKCPPMSPEVAKSLLETIKKDPSYQSPKPFDERPKYLGVMGSRFLIDYLDELSSVEDFGFTHVLPLVPIPGEGQNPNRANAIFPRPGIVLNKPTPWMSKTRLGQHLLKGLVGLSRAVAVNVEHCNAARALLLQAPNKFSVAYSGDCRPSGTFAWVAKNSTVLIHEATFDDELKGEARAKKHSTVGEAIGVASLMQAKSLILSHFSQRYQKIPVLENIWRDTEEVAKQIVKETDKEPNGEAKGPGAGEEVDEIAPDAEDLPVVDVGESTAQSGNAENMALDDSEDEDLDLQQQAPSLLPTPKRMPILFSFDYMRVCVGDIPKIQAYRPALAKLFEEDIEELERRQAKAASNAAAAAMQSPKRQGSVRKKKDSKMRKVEVEQKDGLAVSLMDA
ncbi:uncharacterized protein PV09_04178 [Verruconis gallopava]|uniref:ribonuclease Z n=1 Tax=Verruconis gallopava TaxID=253628 RepID=A0A0D2ADI9_9PEZI|nr:uncharacterized protein PV09_04178 [Verruconis gallopava]KIW05023.1 hypothetical protein PV09_04178 [Verruconis gallopava]